jgi:MinD-like ATPase involved in chromosome partitioning or flagellar assembly
VTVTFDIEPELEQGITVEYFLHDLVSQQVRATVPPVISSPRRRISERIAEIMADVPAEEFAKIPRDGSRQVDHYVYGLPKRLSS